MAYGIEELAEMKVTGPVQGGDMVAKPNEMPVGAAALLAKMQKKNTPGLFKLPEVDKEMPSFMKVAAEGVEEQNTANLEDAEILRIMGTYGVGPEEARRIYDEMIYGYERDEAAVSPNDWRTILKMIESGMSQEEIDAQLALNEIRKDTQKVAAFAPEGHQLAYITPEEGELLKMTGGTGETNKITGIKQYPGGYGTVDTPWGAGGESYVTPGQTSSSYVPGAGSTNQGGSNDVAQAANLVVNDKGQTLAEALAASGQSGTSHLNANQIQNLINEEGIRQEIVEAQKKKDAEAGEEKDDSEYWYSNMPLIQAFNAISGAVGAWEEAQVEDLVSKIGTGEAAGGWGNLLYDFKNDPERMQRWMADWGDKLGTGSLDAAEKNWDEMSDEETLKELVAMASASGGDEFEKRYDPQKFYGPLRDKDGKIIKESTAEYQKRMRKKGVTPKELAEAQKFGKIKFTKANTQMIEEGRRRLEEDRHGSQGKDLNKDGGGSAPSVDEEVQVTENVDVDPRAGAFNVGGTMKYKDDLRTGGKEMDVPLGSRFDIDKSGKFRGSKPMTFDEAIKYATVGGYSQLEPFQEYLTRRRKELGEQPDEWFDEEGNIIFSKDVSKQV